MIRTPIIDHITEIPVNVDKYHRALNVIEYPHEFKIPLFEHLINSQNSINMGLDGSLDSSTNIWNGDSGNDWSWSDNGSTVVDSGAFHSGNNGLYIKLENKDKIEFTNVDTDLSNATLLQFWIQPKDEWENDGHLKIRLKLNGSYVGDELDIFNYMSDHTKDVWQQITIPLSDFKNGQIGNIDYIRFKANDEKYFWFDDFNFGSPDIGNDPGLTRFGIKAKNNIRYFINSINITIIDDSEVGPTSWDGNKFGNMNSLNSSINLKFIKNNHIHKNWHFKDNSDLIEQSSNIQNLIGLTKTVVTFKIQLPTLVLKSSTLNKFEADINNDLSGLDKLCMAIEGYTIDEEYFQRDRQPGVYL